MSHSPLFEPLLAFCRRASELLERETAKDGLPRIQARRIEKPTPEVTLPVEETVVDWNALMERYGSAIEGLPEYGVAVSAMEADGDAARHLDALVGASGGWQVRVDARGCLRGLLVLALQACGPPLSDEGFEGAFDQLERFFRDDRIAFDCVAPIDGLTIEQDRIELGPGHWIEKLTLGQKAELQTEALSWPDGIRTGGEASAFIAYIASPKWITSLKESAGTEQQTRDPFDSHVLAFRAVARQLLVALRLFKTGNVAIRYVRMSPRFWSPVSGLHREVWSSSVRGIREDSYLLSRTEADAFVKFHDGLRRKPWSRGALGVAIRRFCASADRPLAESPDYLEDQLIDSCIALEALLLPDGNTELSYRLALRGAALLGHSPAERIASFNLLRAAYGARSRVVHGEMLGDRVKIQGVGDIDVRELVHRTAGATRSLIGQFVEWVGRKNPEQVVTAMDEAILAGPGSEGG